jgi:hypothetical protein
MLLVRCQTFHFDLKSEPCHLWVIASDPDPAGNSLIVSLTSLKGSKDQTVILHAGEHPFIKWATCVAYGQSDLISEEKLSNFIAQGNARMHTSPMKPETTNLIFDGFLASDFTKNRIRNYVKDLKEKKKSSTS